MKQLDHQTNLKSHQTNVFTTYNSRGESNRYADIHPVNIKYFAFLITFILLSINTFAQTASGTITFNTSGSETLAIDVVATDLFDGGNNVYNLSGNTNQAINFSNWTLVGALAVGDYELAKKGYMVLGNPSGELNALVTVANNQDITAKVVDINGRTLSIPKITQQGNNTVKLYDPLTNIAAGVYFVQVNNTSFQFIKSNSSSNTLKPAQKNKSILAGDNYKIAWSGNGITSGEQNVEFVEGNSNAINIDVDLTVTGNETGDVAITTDLKGNSEYGTIIKLTNMQVPDSTYTINTTEDYAIFYNIHVANNHNPTQYKIEVTDSDADGRFLKTTTYEDIYQDENFEINGTKLVNLNEIPNEVKITKTVYNYTTTNRESGVTVKLYLSDSNTLFGTGITNGNGEVVFDNVPGNTKIHFENEKSGFYGKVNESYTTKLVDLISEMTDSNNMTALPHFNLRDGTSVTANDLNRYNTTVFDTDFIIGRKHIHLPDISGGNQIYKDHFNDVAAALGNPGAFIFVASPLSNPTSTMLANYNPYPQNQQIYDDMGSNVTDFSGTTTNTSETTLFNGNKAITHTINWQLGGINDWSNTDHEIINAMSKMPAFSYVPTSRNTDSGASVSIEDSTYDSGIMPVIIGGAIYHYKTTDASGKNIEQNLPKEYK